MGDFHKKVREVSQDVIQLLEDLIDEGVGDREQYENVAQDHRDLLRGISDVSIISATYSRAFQFLQTQEELFKKATSFTHAVLCKVMAKRVREVIVNSLRETQPIEILDRDKQE